jgi:PAS domain S-box-containing protein
VTLARLKCIPNDGLTAFWADGVVRLPVCPHLVTLIRSTHNSPSMKNPMGRRVALRAVDAPPTVRHGIAVALALIAILARRALDPFWGENLPFILFFPAIMLSAWVGGAWAGIVTTAVCVAGARYFWLAPRESWLPSNSSQVLGLFVFGAVGVLISVLNESWRRAISERDEQDLKVRELAAIVASSEDAIISKDLDGRIRSWNRAAQRMFGFSATEAVGQPIRIIIPETRWYEEDEVLRRLRSGETIDHFETVRRRKDGTELPVSLTMSPIHDANGIVIGASKIARDITERQRAEETEREQSRALALAEQRLAELIEAIPGVVWESAPGSNEREHRNTFLSRQVETMLGYPLSQWKDPTFWHSIMRPEDVELNARAFAQALQTGEPFVIEFPWKAQNGRTLWAELRASVIKDGAGRSIGWRGVTLDVTSRKEAERGFHEANRQKDEFLAMLSHELRTPTNGILGWASMLKSGTVYGERRERAIEGIYNNAQRQSQLIDEVMDISRIVSGKLRLQPTAVSLDGVVREAAELLQRSADAKHIDLRVEIDPVLSTFYGDPLRLQQVVSNLVSNAIKFTPEHGTVDVRLRQAGDTLELSVSDTGEGIPREFLDSIFEPFRQVEGPSLRRNGGLGLGLAIVRQIVEAHHGTVSAESNGTGQGATFRVRLPLVGASAAG